ncbi:flagellar basal body-associated FliL family protein [Opitutus terrae]|uniref:Flagellar protein FliL n=1 Tax=Opitutus terrae (strain DSM 11246 / JCM 15787 / PB90-1) TaxID=452637 RepID=B1ZR36_OPITP|nr:flagellar basal body-associated FliL family protein [Opitutus terrae]ACB73703.1 flagellar basal body-associated protein FliL [Opitutus terrae PB90-1]
MAKAAPTPAAAAPGGAPAPAASAPAAPALSAAAPSAAGGLKAWLPAIATVVLAPVCTWAVCQFVLIPQLEKKLGAAPVAEQVATEEGHGEGGAHGKNGKDSAPNYEFQNMVVNLSGTMGTRYLKTSFLVTGSDPEIKSVFETNKARLTDVTLNVLSSLSLADLEEPGAKNVLREKLVSAYNQALGRKVAEQVYFSDFVVQ